jgi:LAS superfamily LD-carboxypeptidase LdcB
VADANSRFAPREAIGTLLVGAGTYGLVRLVRLWAEREQQATGYVAGKAFAITVVSIDGKPVEVATAAAFSRMRDAAAAERVTIKVVSGFRTMAEQEYLYGCYKSGTCNNGNLAARPGYSNHQSGHALDLNARDPAVGLWLRTHANAYGFHNTVPSEPWHWEYWP